MKDDMIVEVKNLSKCYKLYDKPIDRLKESLHPLRKNYHRDFYALNDISFEIKKGETIGIIGKNGSGKSTILKIITGVLTPTNGSVAVHGKISALLELGAGFNPEFTGIENVYLNGTIMGYSRKEMQQRITKITEFADIGDFIYQPVKMYSSGMFARLAFAVAINVEPDILIIDEALSVGDIAFQYKCFQRMEELKKRGVTMIIVSHSTQQILQQCDRAILLNQGRLLFDDYDVNMVIIEYQKIMRNLAGGGTESETEGNESDIFSVDDFDTLPNKMVNEKRIGTFRAIIRQVYVSNDSVGYDKDCSIECGRRTYLKFILLAKEDIENVILGVSLRNKEGIDLWLDNNYYAGRKFDLKQGVNKICYSFDFNLVGGEYLLCCGISTWSGIEKEDLDHRWPIKKVEALSMRHMDGVVYAPIQIE